MVEGVLNEKLHTTNIDCAAASVAQVYTRCRHKYHIVRMPNQTVDSVRLFMTDDAPLTTLFNYATPPHTITQDVAAHSHRCRLSDQLIVRFTFEPTARIFAQEIFTDLVVAEYRTAEWEGNQPPGPTVNIKYLK